MLRHTRLLESSLPRVSDGNAQVVDLKTVFFLALRSLRPLRRDTQPAMYQVHSVLIQAGHWLWQMRFETVRDQVQKVDHLDELVADP